MTRKIPTEETAIEVSGLGTAKGVQYEDGVRQFYGIPYAHLQKRWTRSDLATTWADGRHDGRQLG